jgi:hypothetical protein
MTFYPGCKPVNRKLPADEVVKADIDAGMSRKEMGCKYGVHPSAIDRLVRLRGWGKKTPTSVEPKSPPRPILRETQRAVVIERVVMSTRGPRCLRISLPRIPTLHGEFGAAR